MNFKKLNNITGWVVFAIASLTYLLSMERTASFWDCGEFLVTADKLEVAHSPGAPLFMMMGRMFAIFSPSPAMTAMFINSMSALASGFTVLFLFWTITHFARKIVTSEDTDSMTNSSIFSILSAGVVGALAYAFSDTFWFSAVESEVYATSSFFTALTFWAILRWEHIAKHDATADRWLVFIFFLVGLSVGVHLLNLLVMPAIALVYYLRKNDKPTLMGGVIAFIIGGIILGIVQYGIIQGLSIIASKFELAFTNSFGMPFNTGTIVFILLLGALSYLGVKYAIKKGNNRLYIGVFCFIFTFLGFAAPYAATVIRSKADVPIDMVNPDNVVALIPYLQREQYGSQPVFTGSNYDANYVRGAGKPDPVYAALVVDGKDKYVEVGEKDNVETDKTMLFPRMWDKSKQGLYEDYLGLNSGETPTMGDNLKFFFNYQVNWMYWRYFMWNYAGRQNDYQGQGDPKNANWISGIKFLDKMMGKGDIDLASDSYKDNRARNEYYLLPFILGIIGLVYHYKHRKGDTAVVLALFLMTGLAIVVYLNNSPMQPRERDYAYVSTYAFAIWIGIGVMQVEAWLRKFAKGTSAPAIAGLICLVAVPGNMLKENWDDHNRAPKTLAKDHAYNMLMTCDSNAILIVNGDNDTYPLWYLQEIEGIRTDVRVLNQNLLNTDWQVQQMFYKVNKADAVPMFWKEADVVGKRLEYLPIFEDPRLKGMNISAEQVIQFISDKRNDKQANSGALTPYMPTKKIIIPVDSSAVIASGLMNGMDSTVILPYLEVDYSQKNIVMRADLVMLNMIAAIAKEGWNRPIYFGQMTPAGGFEPYLQREGLLSKLVPVMHRVNPASGVNTFTGMQKNIDLMTKVYTYGNAHTNEPYYDDKAKNSLTQYRLTAVELANYLAVNERNADAIKVLDDVTTRISESSYPNIVHTYDNSVVAIIESYYRAGAKEKGAALAEKMMNAGIKDVDYYMSLNTKGKSQLERPTAIMLQSMRMVAQVAIQTGDQVNAEKWNTTFNNLATKTGLIKYFQQPQQPQQQRPFGSNVN